jgi:alpha,alpha-trehalase
MLENFISIVQRFGFIPNGGRVYYSMRSQPPLLTPMIKTYVDTTKDIEFAVKYVDVLAAEFEFWMTNHTVEVMGHTLARYGDKSSGPRPESYREDIETGNAFESEADKEEHYSELKAAAESGMDFSSRWFVNDAGENVGTLENLKTRYIVPVELNAILYWNAIIIAEFYNYAGNDSKKDEFMATAQRFKDVSKNNGFLGFEILNLKMTVIKFEYSN